VQVNAFNATIPNSTIHHYDGTSPGRSWLRMLIYDMLTVDFLQLVWRLFLFLSFMPHIME
jgi:hypothetical protein